MDESLLKKMRETSKKTRRLVSKLKVLDEGIRKKMRERSKETRHLVSLISKTSYSKQTHRRK